MSKEIEIDLPSKIGKGYGSFWRDKSFIKVLKGGRASKKSTTIAQRLIYNIMKYPLANAVVVRNTFNTHKDSTFAILQWAAKNLGVYEQWKFTINPLECTYIPTGQKILFRGFDDPLKLTSITVAKGYLCFAWIEEAFEIEKEEDFQTFKESIRGKVPEGYWKEIVLSFNPWVNTHWTKKYFDSPQDDVFILTTTYKCNEWLDENDRKLIEDLAVTDPERYRVVGLGEYGIPGGAYFDEFRKEIHVCSPFDIPKSYKRYMTIDYGLDMCAVYWIAESPDGFSYVYRELYESNLIVSQAANKIIGMESGDAVDVRYAPPDLYNRRNDTGKNVIEIFAEHGLRGFVKSDNKRVPGWLAVKEYMKPFYVKSMFNGLEYKTAKLQIFDNCVNLIRTLPQLQRDENNPSDVSDQVHELTHGPDALRGFCIMRKILIDNTVNDDEEVSYDDEVNNLINWGCG